jgi:hypothetical protein
MLVRFGTRVRVSHNSISLATRPGSYPRSMMQRPRTQYNQESLSLRSVVQC